MSKCCCSSKSIFNTCPSKCCCPSKSIINVCFIVRKDNKTLTNFIVDQKKLKFKHSKS